MASSDITATPEWAALDVHARRLQAEGVHLRDLFAADPDRPERFTSLAGNLVIDWSRHLVTAETIELLLALADRSGAPERLAAMMAGEPVNTTESRPALHTALRTQPGSASAAAAAAAEHERMGAFVRALHSGERRGATGRPIRTVVNLGIGGSHLGPAMAHVALSAYRQRGIECRFVSNVDPAALASALDGFDPAETLFIVVSKSFRTAETLTNARAARSWVTSTLGAEGAGQHFVAATADRASAAQFGISASDTFTMWDWVGGRFSLGSAAGLALMAAVGGDRFAELLAGMRMIDDHLAALPLESAPMLLGLLGVWYRNFWGAQTRAVVPYSHRLRLLPDWLQQLVMESNGKRVRLDGSPAECDTAEVVWGGPGTDSQHSFHQFLHQGTTLVPIDLLLFARPDIDAANSPDAAERHAALAANCFAQASALAFGTHSDDPHRVLPGNRPSTVIMAPELTPSTLGQLVALYEHQTVVQGAVWGINSFDQFGVEQGKRLADAITADLGEGSSQSVSEHDPSTKSLIAHYHRLNDQADTA